ncbi:hypothetical protein CK203_032332 [Vitis vinifera]|uniref:Reverse transcriptase zinc-binding domain-containing protein n=1 Tax=Vitis vinifera TaxID=29760 RepID=A0A438IK22_VITVI|nr:hypothetical protein CK203_032332 [Vitis vinifera]
MQRNFLWSRAGEGKKDHLVRWEVVSRPKELGGLGFGKISLRNIALLGKWLWRFPRERSGLWYKVIGVYMGHILMDGMPTWWLDGHTDVLGRLLLKVISVKNLTVSNALGNSFPLAWNLNFRRNLTDSEIDLLQRLMSSLSSVRFSPSLADSRAWSLSSSGLFTVKSFFLALSKVSNPILFLSAKFLWSSKVPSKVKALAWIVAHGKVNTNDKLQLRRPYKSLCPQWCILCKGNGDRLITFFFIVLYHWTLNKLFKLAGLDWVPPRSLRILWQERNKRIFEDKGRSEETLWDLILFYSTLWASCSAAFRGVPLNVLQLNWSERALKGGRITAVEEEPALGDGKGDRNENTVTGRIPGINYTERKERLYTIIHYIQHLNAPIALRKGTYSCITCPIAKYVEFHRPSQNYKALLLISLVFHCLNYTGSLGSH